MWFSLVLPLLLSLILVLMSSPVRDETIAAPEVRLDGYVVFCQVEGVVGIDVVAVLHHSPGAEVAEQNTIRHLSPRVGH